ncbi:hypothetical protein [Nocardioides sp. LHG3406-4]|uniref:hypothetical protein n=1 Tax=Nocardioides sp. LHG3406-4 TaxID=2804575 RepID=UPI003CE955D7
MTRRRLLVLGVLVGMVVGAGWVVWDRTHPSYCEVVADHQTELADITSAGGPGASFKVLAAYRDLRAAAPDDIEDEWDRVVGRLEALEEALEDADVDPETYDPDSPPAGLDADHRAAIEGAAREVGSDTTVGAMGELEQQALDVCHTPLTQ